MPQTFGRTMPPGETRMSEQKIEQAADEYRGIVSTAATPATVQRLEYRGYDSYTGEFLYRCSSCGADVAVNPMDVLPPQRHNSHSHRVDDMNGETRRSAATTIWWVSVWWIFYFILLFFFAPILTIMLL